jgi:hypothetical protein
MRESTNIMSQVNVRQFNVQISNKEFQILKQVVNNNNQSK